jgi:hypothetical protein
MNIYVAGTVLREKLETSIRIRIREMYEQIEAAATNSGHEVQLPYPDSALDNMSPGAFEAEIQRRICEADCIISVMDPPNNAVAIEAHYAATQGKPQAILISRLQLHSLSHELAQIPKYIIGEIILEEVFGELEKAVKAKTSEGNREEPPPMLMG